eukprot:476782_1
MLNFESKEKERDQSFSDEIWAECVQRKLPQTALNTKFVVGIANGTLSVDNYAQFMMQDIIYLQHGSETWYRTAKQAKQQNKIDIQQYCEARGKSWQSYAKSLCDKYYVKPKGIVICDALNEYLEYESFVINKYGPEYVLVVFYACVKLWPFIGKTLKKNEDKENNNNLYQFWVDGNLSEKSATRNEKWMNKLYDQGKLDKTLCIKIVCNCIKLEINFFKQACGQELDIIQLYKIQPTTKQIDEDEFKKAIDFRKQLIMQPLRAAKTT